MCGTGLARDKVGELVRNLEGLTLEESVSKQDLIEELHIGSRLTELAIAQLVHQGKILVALESEVVIFKRSFLEKTQANIQIIGSRALWFCSRSL